MAEQSATCASCSKRLSRRQWYYRNGQFFCKKRCWETAKAKAKGEKADDAEQPAASVEKADRA